MELWIDHAPYLCYANCWERDSDKETKDRTNDGYYNKPHAFIRLPDGTVSKGAKMEKKDMHHSRGQGKKNGSSNELKRMDGVQTCVQVPEVWPLPGTAGKV